MGFLSLSVAALAIAGLTTTFTLAAPSSAAVVHRVPTAVAPGARHRTPSGAVELLGTGPASLSRSLSSLPAPAGIPAAGAVPVPGAPASRGSGALRPRGRFTWPLSPAPTVLRRFDPPPQPWSAGHRGVDLAAATGQPVLAAASGTVGFSGLIAGRGVVTVLHAGGIRTTYEPVVDALPAGAAVGKGQRIALLGATPGHCSPATCLHWGALRGKDYLDPLSLLGFGHPVLLPLR